MPTKIIINGRFLNRRMTGVERYATELVKEIDNILELNPGKYEWELVRPPGAQEIPLETKNIKLVEFGFRAPQVWEQISFPLYAKNGFILNLCNSGPLFKRRSLTIIHDTLIYKMPQSFSRIYRLWHDIQYRSHILLSNIGTVSDSSRQDLLYKFPFGTSEIAVIPNGSGHLGRSESDETIFERINVTRKQYFLFVGSPAPHKNLARALEAFQILSEPRWKFVVVGSAKSNIFRDSQKASNIPGVIFTGRLSDPEIAALYSNATALVFPSLHEGFGIPPLEAYSYGCRVLASDIDVLHEVCGSAATYFDPYSSNDIASAMKSAIGLEPISRESIDGVIAKYQWKVSAEKLIRLIGALSE